jgi:hypothetical protein
MDVSLLIIVRDEEGVILPVFLKPRVIYPR